MSPAPATGFSTSARPPGTSAAPWSTAARISAITMPWAPPPREAGFKIGTAYVGGKAVPSYGGGVCQVSSTLYYSALLANLKIVSRPAICTPRIMSLRVRRHGVLAVSGLCAAEQHGLSHQDRHLLVQQQRHGEDLRHQNRQQFREDHQQNRVHHPLEDHL